MFCLLDNDFLSTSSQYTGWNPSYTISSFLLQVQNFLSEPDLPFASLPNEEKIEELMKSMDDYENVFVVKNDGEEIIKIHTWKNPYPEIYFKNIEDKKNNDENEENKNQKEIKADLTCYISRLNYIDDNSILLGYPIKKTDSGSFLPIPEILSYDSYIEELSKRNEYSGIYYGFNFFETFNAISQTSIGIYNRETDLLNIIENRINYGFIN